MPRFCRGRVGPRVITRPHVISGAAIVGTPDQVLAKLRAYQAEGIEAFILSGYPHAQEADLFAMSVGELANRYTQAYHVPEDLLEFKDGSLHIMPAGKFDGSYAQRFDDLNLHVLYEQGLGEPLIRAFKKKFAEAESAPPRPGPGLATRGCMATASRGELPGSPGARARL